MRAAPEELEQAKRLVDRCVRFAHQPTGPTHLVVGYTTEGLVVLNDMVGEFGPHIFVVVQAIEVRDQ